MSFLTVHGATAVATNAATGVVLANLAATADLERRQIEYACRSQFTIPRKYCGSRCSSGRVMGHGQLPVFHSGDDGYRHDAGGAGTNVVNPPAFFNVAYRDNDDEPDATGQTFTRWRDGVQGSTLAATVTVNGVQTHDLSRFSATVDFVKLARHQRRHGVIKQGSRIAFIRAVTRSGKAWRIPRHPTHEDPGCTPTSTVAANGTTSCIPSFDGRLQPYSLYVPAKVPPRPGTGSSPTCTVPGQLSAQPASKRRTLDRPCQQRDRLARLHYRRPRRRLLVVGPGRCGNMGSDGGHHA
jgi:hypothetical protein